MLTLAAKLCTKQPQKRKIHPQKQTQIRKLLDANLLKKAAKSLKISRGNLDAKS